MGLNNGGGSVSFASPTVGVASTAAAGVASTAVRSDATLKIPMALIGMTPIAGGRFKRVLGQALATGNNNLYTAPANTRALVSGAWMLYNSGGVGAITSQPYIQFQGAGTRYSIASVNSALATSAGVSIAAGGLVLEPGDVLGITTSTSNGLNVALSIIEYPSSIPVYSSIVKNPASGDNTVYTCPALTNAVLTSASSQTWGAGTVVSAVNGSGGSLNNSFNIVPSGGSVSTGNQIVPTAAVAGTTVTRTNLSTPTMMVLNAGDFISINWSGANTGGLSWVTIAEIAGA